MISHLKSITVLILVSFLILFQILPGFLINPNDILVAQGGDAMVIYYDMVYQVCHNPEYIQFYGMNYPFGESLIMTDAQAALTITLKFIHENIFSLCDMVPGIIHSFIVLLIPLTAIFLYLILIKLKCSRTISILFALLITFLSPQLQRVGGHFGLAYPFLIPMVMYWFIDKYNSVGFKWRDIGFGFILYFFFVNNPYVGFAGSGLFLVSGALVLLLERNKKGILLLLIGLTPLILGYITVLLSDPFDDRIIRQWGFFHYFASLAGLFFPKGSLLYEILNPAAFFGEVRFEGNINVGMVTTITILTGIITYVVNKLLNKKGVLSIPLAFKYLFWGSFIMFLYAANYSLYGFAKEFMEEHMGPLLMFKASGRLAWPFYYGLTIMSAIIIHQCYQKYKINWWSIWLIILIPAAIWAYEDFTFLHQRYKKLDYKNLFKDKEISSLIDSLDINKNRYEAIYLIPVIQTWNDKFLFELDFKTQRAAMVISAHTGIPMINGMMSRAPLESSISAIQLAAHPVIERSRLKYFSGDKPFLIIYGNQKQKLTIGEKAILDKAQPIGEILRAQIYSLVKKDFEAILPVVGDPTDDYIHFSWDDEIADATLTPPGALTLSKGRQILFKDSLAIYNSKKDILEISLWHYSDYRSYGVPKLIAVADGKEHSFFNRSSYDFIGYWGRQSIILPAPKVLEIITDNPYNAIYDDLHIQRIQDTTLITIDKINIWNNYPLIKEDRFSLVK